MVAILAIVIVVFGIAKTNLRETKSDLREGLRNFARALEERSVSTRSIEIDWARVFSWMIPVVFLLLGLAMLDPERKVSPVFAGSLFAIAALAIGDAVLGERAWRTDFSMKLRLLRIALMVAGVAVLAAGFLLR